MIGAVLALALQAGGAGPAADPIADFIEDNAASVREMRIAAAPASFCSGTFREGSFLVCRFLPDARVEFGDMDVRADTDGYVMLAIPRQAPDEMPLRITYTRTDGVPGEIAERVTIAQREYDLQPQAKHGPKTRASWKGVGAVRTHCERARQMFG